MVVVKLPAAAETPTIPPVIVGANQDGVSGEFTTRKPGIGVAPGA